MMCSLQKINQKTEIKTLTSGWFQTEDLAELSNQGQHVVLNLLGRNSDYIKINAEGVSLEHLREIFGHSLEFALLAIPNERREHEIVVVHAGVDQIQNAVTDFNKKVKPFERIRRIYAVNEIPLSELKKILYKKIELMIKDSPYEKI